MPAARVSQSLGDASCQMVSEEGLQALNAGCPGLRRMTVASFRLVREEGLQAVIAGGLGLQSMGDAISQMVNEEGLQSGRAQMLAQLAAFELEMEVELDGMRGKKVAKFRAMKLRQLVLMRVALE